MARVFITGSADGLGKMAASLLVKEGHQVVLHARNAQRAADAMKAVPGAETALAADLSDIAETKALSVAVNALGKFDAVIHNAGLGYREPKRSGTADGLPAVFAVNTLAAYILTCLIDRPKRMVYLSSGLHREGDASLKDLLWNERAWSGYQAYCDSKLHDVILAFAVAARWKNVFSNALEPGWVATRMGGAGAPDSLDEGPVTQAWLAAGEEPAAQVSGKYFFHQKPMRFHAAAEEKRVQERLLRECARYSGVEFPL